MSPTVVFVHTICGLKPLFDDLLGRFVQGVRTCHIADETLIRSILEAGGLTPAVRERLAENVLAADRFGATVIQLTCSSVSPCVGELTPRVRARLLSIDEPMAVDAVGRFDRIGVIATNPGTLTPSTELVADLARRAGREVQVQSVLCEGAYQAYLAGKAAEHDRIVTRDLLDLMGRVDVVLLAQASMTRIVETLPPERRSVPVLSSPEPAMRRLAAVLEEAL